ncbi:hypothetical protein JMUB6875_41810 [Nocardia sp. JMUB6875]
MQGVRGIQGFPGRIEHAFPEHHFGAVATLLPRLEHENNIAAEQFAAVGQQSRRTHQPGRMQVVPAGVHQAVEPGAEFLATAFLYRQRIHVRAQQRRAAAPSAAQDRGHRAQTLAQRDLEREPVESLEHLLLSARQAQPEFRLPV